MTQDLYLFTENKFLNKEYLKTWVDENLVRLKKEMIFSYISNPTDVLKHYGISTWYMDRFVSEFKAYCKEKGFESRQIPEWITNKNIN